MKKQQTKTNEWKEEPKANNKRVTATSIVMAMVCKDPDVSQEAVLDQLNKLKIKCSIVTYEEVRRITLLVLDTLARQLAESK